MDHLRAALSKTQKEPEIELAPDAWQRFEKAVSTVAKSGPKHRPAKPGKANRRALEEKKAGAIKAHD
jgi:hypothetical protein